MHIKYIQGNLLRQTVHSFCSLKKQNQKTPKFYLILKGYLVGMTQPMQSWSHSGNSCHQCACTGLGLSTVNHRSVRGPFGLTPPCWNMSYWWIWGEGQTLSSVLYPWWVHHAPVNGSKLMLHWHPLLNSELQNKTERPEYENGTGQEWMWTGGGREMRRRGWERSKYTMHMYEIVTRTNSVKHSIWFCTWLVLKRQTILVAQWVNCLLYKYENSVFPLHLPT